MADHAAQNRAGAEKIHGRRETAVVLLVRHENDNPG